MPVKTALDIANMLPATFTRPGLTEREFLSICETFSDAKSVEYTADSEVIIMPGTDPRSGARGAEVVFQLTLWAREQGRGMVTGPDTSFLLRDGSRRSPDAAWFDRARFEAAEQPDTRFPVFVPDFVVEVRSPEQRARGQREKMEEYIANGVKLGWLIDPIERTVTIYRPGQAPEVLSHPASVPGEGPVAGFVLQMDRILA